MKHVFFRGLRPWTAGRLNGRCRRLSVELPILWRMYCSRGAGRKIDRVIEMPVKNITTCTFGGADLKTLLCDYGIGSSPGRSAWPADCSRFNARSAARQKTGSAVFGQLVRKAVVAGGIRTEEKRKGTDVKVPFRQQASSYAGDIRMRCGMSPGISSLYRTRRTCCLPVRPDNIRCRQRFRQRRICPSSPPRLHRTKPCSPCPLRAPSLCNAWI